MAFQPRVVGGNGERRQGFVYRPRSAEQVKERMDKGAGRVFDSMFKEKYDIYKVKDAMNVIRILPPTWDDPNHYAYEIFAHRYVGADGGQYLCPRKMLNKPCAICDASAQAKREGDSDEASRLAWREMRAMWILDRQSKDPTLPLLHTFSARQDQLEILPLTYQVKAGGTGAAIQVDHPDKGYDLSFMRTKTGKEAINVKYSAWRFGPETSPIDDDINVQDEITDYIEANPIPRCLQFYPNDYLADIMSGQTERIRSDDDFTEDRRRLPTSLDPRAARERGEGRYRQELRGARGETEERPRPRYRDRDEPPFDDDPPTRRSLRDVDDDPRSSRYREEPEEELTRPVRREELPRAMRGYDDEPAPRRRVVTDDGEDELPSRVRRRLDEPAPRRRVVEEEPPPRRRSDDYDDPAPTRRSLRR